jgi:hypothetical protein
MTAMRAARLSIAASGLAALGYGLLLMADTGWQNIVRTLYWLVGGVIAHDAILAPATIAVVVISSRFLPAWARGSAAVGMIVLGSLTLLAVPELGRFGARPDNPTLLDRDYTRGWLVVAAIVVVYVVVGSWLRRRHDVRRGAERAAASRSEDAGR